MNLFNIRKTILRGERIMPLKCGENKLSSTAGASRMGATRQAAEDAAKATVKHDAQGAIDNFVNQECPSDCPRKEVFADEDTDHGVRYIRITDAHQQPSGDWIATAAADYKALVYCLPQRKTEGLKAPRERSKKASPL
jgi:hypothetical protein